MYSGIKIPDTQKGSITRRHSCFYILESWSFLTSKPLLWRLVLPKTRDSLRYKVRWSRERELAWDSSDDYIWCPRSQIMTLENGTKKTESGPKYHLQKSPFLTIIVIWDFSLDLCRNEFFYKIRNCEISKCRNFFCLFETVSVCTSGWAWTHF